MRLLLGRHTNQKKYFINKLLEFADLIAKVIILMNSNVHTMNEASNKFAGILLIILPTVAFGGTALLNMLITDETGYADNPLRQDLMRAGHAHAGVLLILSLVILKYVDEANLSANLKRFVRAGTPITAILIPAAFFLSVADPQTSQPNGFIYLAYAGFVLLTITLLTVGIGLIRRHKSLQ